jgi:hypothetical protein
MKTTLILLFIIGIINLLSILYTPWTASLLTDFAIMLAFALIIYMFGFAIANAVSRTRFFKPQEPSHQTIIESLTPFWNWKVQVVLVAAFLAELLAMVFVPFFKSLILAEIVYYLVLIASGVTLSLWCKSQKYVPLLNTTIMTLALSTINIVLFLNNPGAQFRYGPEIIFFALRQHIVKINLLPVDAVVALVAWRIASTLTRQHT